MPFDPSMTQIVQWLSSISGSAVLALVCYFWFTRKLITRGEYDAVVAEKDFWRDTALRSLGNTERATATAEKAASAVQQVVNK